MCHRTPILVPVLVLSLLSVLAQDAQTSRAWGATPPATAKVLRIDWEVMPETLDPHLAHHISEAGVSALDYEGLTRIDEELATVPAAAESWQFSENGTTLTFRLRAGLMYSDGSPLTAERFRYAIERGCDPRTAVPYASLLFGIVGCEALFTSLDGAEGPPTAAFVAARAGLGVRALDESTLEIALTKPAAYFPAVASTSIFFPVQQEVVEADPEGWWRDPDNRIGNGPFRMTYLDLATDDPVKIAFAASERYWGGPPKLDGLELIIVTSTQDPDAILEMYRRGALDMTFPYFTTMPAIEADPELSAQLRPVGRAETYILGFNLTREPFQDKLVREAFAYGFDREAYCYEIDFGFCSPTFSWIPPDIPGHFNTDAYAYDPAKARQALAASSYGDPEALPAITFPYPADWDYFARVAAWLQAQYESVLGIELILEPLPAEEWSALFADSATYPQLELASWVQDYPDPQNWLSLYWTCSSTIHAQSVGYCNDAFDALTARADAESDPATRLALYEEAGRLLVADVPAVFIFNRAPVALINPAVTGYALTPIDTFPGSTTPLTIDIAPRQQE